MIKISFSSAISIYLSVSIFLVFALWVFYNYYRSGISNETKYLQQCPYCTYLFFNYQSEDSKGIRTRENIGVSETASNDKGHLTENTHWNGKIPEVLICPRCHSYINF
jgi:hypothetical protein